MLEPGPGETARVVPFARQQQPADEEGLGVVIDRLGGGAQDIAVAAVKKQLAELQKSVEALDAALQAAPAEKPATPDEKKPEEKK